MATFEAQVEGLTGIGGSAALDGSSTPTDVELDQFLKDGVIDVTRRTLAIAPQESFKFQRSTTSDSQGVSVGGAQIVTVMREASADGSSSSLYFASIYNPVYVIENNNTINVYPVPSSSNGMKIIYINEEPRDITNNAALVHTHENIKYFPNDKVYLVVIYAAIKCLEAKMADYTITEEDPELVTTIVQNLATLKQQYEGAFSKEAK